MPMNGGSRKEEQKQDPAIAKSQSLRTQDSSNTAKKWQGSYFQIEICKPSRQEASYARGIQEAIVNTSLQETIINTGLQENEVSQVAGEA